MGGCFSSVAESHYTTLHHTSSAYVVTLAGKLRLYALPVNVSRVLSDEASSLDSAFLCNCDRLNFNDDVPSLAAEEELEPGQIYFVLPISDLHHRIAASEMAALAVKANVALTAAFNRPRSRRIRIFPILSISGNCFPVNLKNKSSDSLLKVQRYNPRRPRLPVRSVKLRLTAINEDYVLLD